MATRWMWPQAVCWAWSQDAPGRWRKYTAEDVLKRDKANLDIFWLKDESLEDAENLPPPEVLAQEIADDLQTALDEIRAVIEDLAPAA